MKKVEVIVEIHTKPSRVIEAFTNDDMLRAWWDVERTLIEKRIGGAYTLAWNITDKGFGFVSSGIIKNYIRDSVLEVDNFIYLNPGISILGPMKLIVHAKEKGKGAELYVCQDGYKAGGDWDWYYQAVKHAWPEVLNKLKGYLEKNI
jgi:Activator of Hsp90 ATPase homolog 1-like protein